MRRDYHRWWSHGLRRDMELLLFGHAGPPMLVFPTSLGAFHEYEDRGMVGALADKIERGDVQLWCLSTLDGDTFYGRHRPPRDRIDRYLQYERYLLDEVVPLVRGVSGWPTAGLTGCSFGAYHAFTMALRHPDVFTSCIAMGGAFEISGFLDGYADADTYLLSPPQFLPSLADPWFLDRYRTNKWVLVTGEHDICRGQTEEAAALLGRHGIPHSLHVWGLGSEHDWPEWRRMAAAYVP